MTVTFSVANTEAPVGHMTVWVEDDRHDIPRRGELRWEDIATKHPEEVALVLSHTIVDLDVVVGAAGVVFQLEVVKGEVNGGALWHHNLPGAVAVVGVRAGKVWTGDIPRGCRKDSSTFETFVTRDVSY